MTSKYFKKRHDQTIARFLNFFMRQLCQGILIIDNCDPPLHNLLRYEVEHTNSKLSLLTLDFNPDKHDTCPYIEIEPMSDSVIKGILKQAYHGLPEPDIDRITDFSQGFPQMAVLLAEARINFSPQIGSLQDDEIIRKLLWGRNAEDPIAYKVITTCALFEILGYSEDMAVQRIFAAEKICGINMEDFFAKTRYFIRRGILDVRGRFVRVTPRPLAIRLAADWWMNCSPERARTVIMEDFPQDLDDALCKQLAKLDFLPEAQKLTEDLCGPQAPFGQAEVLTTEKGLRLFRSFVIVNPDAAIKTLNRVFGGMSRDELLKVDSNTRRDLVRSLENLCFWESTFPVAASLLCSFAAAENETWANNATGQFKQLFHYVLSGTQANLKSRIMVIDRCMKSECSEKRKICIQALSSALQNGQFSRMVGVENQGSRPTQEEYRPSTWEEIFDYWTECLNRLVHIVCTDNEFADYTKSQIAERLRGLLGAGRVNDIEACIQSIVSCRGSLWPEALSAIRDCIRYEGKKMPPETVERISSWIDHLQPNNITDQLKLLVSIPPWNHEKNSQGKYVDLAAKDAIDFANQITDDIECIIKNIDVIFHGEQRQGIIFGRTLGEKIESPHVFIDAACDSMAKSPETANPIVLSGLLQSINSRDHQIVENTILMLDKLSLYKQIIDIIRNLIPLKSHLEKVIGYVKDNKIAIHELLSFKYGGYLDDLSREDINWFVDQLLNFGINGHAVAIDLLYMHSFQNKIQLQSWVEVFKGIIRIPNLLINKHLDLHIWENISVLILETYDDDEVIIKFILSEILGAFSERKRYLNLSVSIKDVLVVLIKKHYRLTWPIFSNLLIKDMDSRVSYEIMHLLETGVELEMSSSGYICLIPEEYLIAWCDTPDKAIILSRIAPVYGSDENTYSSIASFLFDEYGSNKNVLTNIFRNLTPNGWTGSIIPYYEQAISALKQLGDHRSSDVALWSRQMVEHFSKSIKTEKRREDEHDIGAY